MPQVVSSCLLANYGQTFAQKVFTKLIQQGPIPKHIAIVMDGNRRYAKQNMLKSPTDGHKVGEQKVMEVANMLLDLGITECTMYSLSEDNLKRSPAEIKGIMDITIKRMEKLLSARDELKKLGIRWNVVGNWEKIPSVKTKSLLAKACKLTKDNRELTLNIAFAYSAHRQIAEGVSHLANGLLDESLQLDDLNEELLNESLNLYEGQHPVDILIRTGGDSRLSDFVLWQCSTASLEFIQSTWPEFGNWDLLRAVFSYQRQVVFEGLPMHVMETEEIEMNGLQRKRQICFLKRLRDSRWSYMDTLIE